MEFLRSNSLSDQTDRHRQRDRERQTDKEIDRQTDRDRNFYNQTNRLESLDRSQLDH
jgi:hypothetical protein